MILDFIRTNQISDRFFTLQKKGTIFTYAGDSTEPYGSLDLHRPSQFKLNRQNKILLAVAVVMIAFYISTQTPASASTTEPTLFSEFQKHELPAVATLAEEIVATPTPTQTPQPTPQLPTVVPRLDTEQQARVIAREFGINEDTFICVLRQESGLNSHYANGALKCGDNGRSCGLGQIQYPTWVSIRRNAGWSTDDLRGDDIENMKTTAYGLKTFWKYHWTGYRTCEAMGYTI